MTTLTMVEGPDLSPLLLPVGGAVTADAIVENPGDVSLIGRLVVTNQIRQQVVGSNGLEVPPGATQDLSFDLTNQEMWLGEERPGQFLVRLHVEEVDPVTAEVLGVVASRTVRFLVLPSEALGALEPLLNLERGLGALVTLPLGLTFPDIPAPAGPLEVLASVILGPS